MVRVAPFFDSRYTLLIDLTIGKHLQILVKVEEVYVQEWHLRYKNSDISETKQSRAKVITSSVYKNSCTAYRLVTNMVT